MKTLLKKLSILLVLITVLSCSKDDAPANIGVVPAGNCRSGDFTLTQTDLDNSPGSNYLFINFDVKNISATNYSILTSGTGNFIKYNIT